MKHSHLIKVLRENLFLQGLLSTLPCILIIIFTFAYMTDLSNVFYSLSFNNNVVADGLKNDSLIEVSDSVMTKDGKFDILLSNRGIRDIDTFYDCPILRIYALDDGFYKVMLYDEKYTSTFVESFDFMTYKGDKKVTVDDKDITITDDDNLLCDVIVQENGYKIEFFDKDNTEIVLDSFENVRVISSTEDAIKLSYSYDYDIELKGKDVNFSNSLPTDSIYFDINNYGFITNISDDLCWNFIFGSKILIVAFCIIILLVLLLILRQQKDLKILSRREPYIFTIIAFSVLPLLILVTILLLK